MSTTRAPPAHLHRPRVTLWLVAVIALAAALVALGAKVLVDQTRSSSSSTQGLASPEVATMLANRIAAMNSGNIGAAAALFTRNAVMEERDQVPVVVNRGREAIDSRLSFLYSYGMRLERVGAPIQVGRYVGEAVRVYESGGTGTGEALLVYEIDKKSGKIAHEWVMGETRE